MLSVILSALCPPAPLKSLTFWRYTNQIIIIIIIIIIKRWRSQISWPCMKAGMEMDRAIHTTCGYTRICTWTHVSAHRAGNLGSL